MSLNTQDTPASTETPAVLPAQEFIEGKCSGCKAPLAIPKNGDWVECVLCKIKTRHYHDSVWHAFPVDDTMTFFTKPTYPLPR